ncbi:MAG: DUF4386 domain-containing protein [Chthoniobacterales bacterium]|nr:DUF4386 domain-containing protein [Chthoniobacterales bacterium]
MFFGLHIGIVGYLIVTSALVPRVLGVLLMIGGLCYELQSFASFLAAPFAKSLFPHILLPAFFAELALLIWLIAEGVTGGNPAPSGREGTMKAVASYSDYRAVGGQR